MNVVRRRDDHTIGIVGTRISQTGKFFPERGASPPGCPDLRSIHVRALRRPGADLDRDHRTEADQAEKNKPDHAFHDASRCYSADSVVPRRLSLLCTEWIVLEQNPFNK
jgi:hypothetical protein